MTAQSQVHGCSVAINGIAILIRGEPASGKSDLLLQLLETTGTGLGDATLQTALIADDQTLLTVRGDRLWAGCPATINGLLEVRGQGIIAVPPHGPAPLGLVIDLLPVEQIERMPEDDQRTVDLMGFRLPRVFVGSGSVSAASRVRLAWVRQSLKNEQHGGLPLLMRQRKQ